jgi:arylformamidase
MTDWDDAYENSAYISGAADYPGQWAADAETYRDAAVNAEYDIAYGNHGREKYDLFQPDGTPKGVLVFVHGGYWMKLDKSSWSHLAQGALARGWAVAMPSYVLTPEVRISDITRQIGAAVGHVAGRVGGAIRLAGHSAGGHLVSRMTCEGGPLGGSVAARIEHVMSISGLHDLRPLLGTSMNATLGLDEAEAAQESAFLAKPVAGARLTCWVGADERPEFVRQARIMGEAWPGTRVVEDAGHHHFSVIAGLADPNSDIVNSLLG